MRSIVRRQRQARGRVTLFSLRVVLWCVVFTMMWWPPALMAQVKSSAGRTAVAANTPIHAVRCEGGATSMAPSLAWRGDVVQWAEWPVRLGSSGIRNRIIVARMPASRMRFSLEIARRGEVLAPWSLNEAPDDAVIAFNAGQFTDDGPWGWVVHQQRERQPPGVGSLAGAFVVDSSGSVALLTAPEISAWRSPLRVIEAVQSYPMLLEGKSRAPSALCDAASGLDLTHRDARLAIGVTRPEQGETFVLVVMSRYEVPGGGATRVPIGPTTPEMAEILRQLGADRALMLDGGLSAQLLLRSATDSARWPGLRDVPLALAGRRR